MIINHESLLTAWGQLASDKSDSLILAQLIHTLDEQYDLLKKIEQEPGTQVIVEQMLGRLITAVSLLSSLSGKRILDIACGSNSSQTPPTLYINTPLQTATIHTNIGNRYTAHFEPWFCRILLILGADPVGIDFGDLSGESFEHYYADLTQTGALDFLPSHSFDAVQDSRLFGSPEFTALLPHRSDRYKIAQEIRNQELRLLKEDGIIIHSDTGRWLDSG